MLRVNAAVIRARKTCAGRDCISIHMEFWLKVDRFEYWLILPQGCEGSELIFYDRVNPSSKGRVAGQRSRGQHRFRGLVC